MDTPAVWGMSPLDFTDVFSNKNWNPKNIVLRCLRGDVFSCSDRTLACVRQTDGRTHADTCYMPRCVLIHAGPTVRICCAVKYALHGGCDLTVCSRLFWSTLSSTLHCWHSEHRYYGIIPLGCSIVVWTLSNWATLRGIVPMAVIRHATSVTTLQSFPVVRRYLRPEQMTDCLWLPLSRLAVMHAGSISRGLRDTAWRRFRLQA